MSMGRRRRYLGALSENDAVRVSKYRHAIILLHKFNISYI